MSRGWFHKGSALPMLLLCGCASAALSPSPDAQPVPGLPGGTQADVAGVRVVAEVDAWPGDHRVLGRVQPVRVTIENRAAVAVRVRYDDFVLVAANGRRYPALPPVRVEGELFSPMLSMGFSPVGTPGFTYQRFYLAPYFAPLYPGVPVYRRRYLFYDPGYYAFWYTDFTRAVRPSVEVLAMALPEGVIEHDGRVTGFLYFRTVDPDAASVTFRARIVSIADDAATLGGTVLGEAAIPFAVRKTR